MFEWFFNYPASSWREASLGFDNTWPLWLLLLLVVIVLFIIGASLVRSPLVARRKLVLWGLQGLVASILLLMLWQPVLELEVAEQGENTVAWIIDTSSSMQTKDVPLQNQTTSQQQSRAEAASKAVRRLALSENAEFDAAIYTQGSVLERVSSVVDPGQSEPSALTNLAAGVDELLGTVSESALAAVVLLSDGSHNAGTIDAQWWQRLGAAGVPVHTIGLGRISDPSDIQLSDVTMPERVAADVQYVATVKVAHGTGGSARIRVLSGRDLVAAQDIDLPEGVSESVHEISLFSGEKGVNQLRFELRSADPLIDPDLTNNEQSRIVRVSDAPKRILYVEGEPRWEFKFIRRALASHPGIDIVSLLRTSPNKFYRQGVRDANELADGFPISREELFSYDAVIIGSLEAAELTTAQQLALRDFVSVRGGSLLMLAGRHGLADGGWGRSVVAAALPVILDARLAADTFTRTRAMALPTVSGYRTPWLSLSGSQAENAQAWQGLPEIGDSQSLGSVKPGAVILLDSVAMDNGGERSEPLLVGQRYGKGQSIVFGTSGTWRWQMGLDSSDQRHESFWRQFAAHLVTNVMQRISVTTSQAVYRDIDTASMTLNAYAADFLPLQQASFPVQLSLPDGSVKNIELQADMQRPGSYNAEVDMPIDGPYTIMASTPLGGESPQSMPAMAEHWWVRESGTAESYDNTQQVDFLQRVADATGGSYLPVDRADDLIDVLSQENAALKRLVSLPLWNMPVFFLFLILAKALEWVLRLRWKRL